MIKKIVCAVIFALLGATLLNGCREYSQIEYISDTLGVDVSYGTMLDSQDSHGGFHGDGLLAVTFAFSPEQEKEFPIQLADQAGWHPFPLSENVERSLYGTDNRNPTTTAPIRDYSTDKLLVPKIEDGWYFFYDRHSEATDPLNDSDLFSRNSYNCTVAVFDADTGILYFFALDT